MIGLPSDWKAPSYKHYEPFPEVGDIVKVSLPGEAPWVEVVAVNPDRGRFEGRLLNRLMADYSEAERLDIARQCFEGAMEPLPALHDFHQNDVVTFRAAGDRWVPDGERGGSA